MSGNGTHRLHEGQPVDFDLHRVIGVRLIGASNDAASAVGAQLGGVARPLARDPDIVVRFVPRLEPRSLCYVERARNGFSDDGFFILSHRKQPVRVRFPFDTDGGPFEVICEHGVRAVPFLDALVRLAALRNGYVPVHASGFAIDGAGVLVPGWAHGGKTSCLLAFARAGATFISDDLVLLSGDGQRMFGVRSPLSVSDWQLAQLPHVRAGRTKRLLAAGGRRLARLLPGSGGGAPVRTMRVALAAAERRLKVELAPETVFPRVATDAIEPRTVLLTFSHADDAIVVEPADPETVAAQLATLLRFELQPCFEQYLAYRFARPGAPCEWLERVEQDAYALLRSALADRNVHVVRHPHPVSLAQLHRVLKPLVQRAAPSWAAASVLAEQMSRTTEGWAQP